MNKQVWGEDENDNLQWEMEQKENARPRNPELVRIEKRDIRRNELMNKLAYCGGSEFDAIRVEWTTERDAIDAEILAERNARLVAAGWTVELTIARREQWNAWVRTTASKFKGQAQRDVIHAYEVANGWTAADLQGAIVMYGLK